MIHDSSRWEGNAGIGIGVLLASGLTSGRSRSSRIGEPIVAAAMDFRDHRRIVTVNSRYFKEPEQFLARVDEIYASSPPETYDLLELADGRVFERFSRIQIVDQRTVGRVWSVRDITDSRVAEEALRKQSEWLRVTLASIGDAVVTTDTQGRVVLLNGMAQTLTGWTQDEAQGHQLTEVFQIINEESRQPVEDPVALALKEGKIVGLANDTILIARDGAETPIDDSAAPIRDDTGWKLWQRQASFALMLSCWTSVCRV